MNINPRHIVGGVMGWLDESDFEMEASLESHQNGKLAIGGRTELNDFNKIQAEQQQKKQTDYERRFYQALKEEQTKTQHAKDMMWLEEEINDITANISTEEKNILLHYQTSYKDRSIYQKAELRKKIIEQAKLAEQKEKAAAIPSPAKQASALETAFEGASGKQGSGTANLSAHATG